MFLATCIAACARTRIAQQVLLRQLLAAARIEAAERGFSQRIRHAGLVAQRVVACRGLVAQRIADFHHV